MRVRATVCGLVVISMIVASCGGGEEGFHTPEELERVLLTAADLGTGWTEQMREVFTTRTEEHPSLDPSLWCPEAGEQVTAMEALVVEPGAVVELRSEAVRDHRFHSVMQQAWSNADVEEFLDYATQAVAVCGGTTWTTDDGEVSMEPEDGPSAGDGSISATATVVTQAPEGDISWEVRVLIARFGKVLTLLEELEVQPVDSEPLLTDGQWADLVDTAAGTIEQLET